MAGVATRRQACPTQARRLIQRGDRDASYSPRVETGWLALVGALFAAGAATAGLVLGGMLVAACALVTASNLCLPSQTFAWLERRRAPSGTTTITT